MILTLSGQHSAGCVKCAHGPGDRDLPSSHAFFLYGFSPRHFAERPKNRLFPAAISFYLGTVAPKTMLVFQTRVPLFCPCVKRCIQCLVLCHSCVAA